MFILKYRKCCLIVAPVAITKVIYEEGELAYQEVEAPATYNGVIYVTPGAEYSIKLEVLKNDLADSSEKVSDIKINDESFGECNPSGDDYDCTFHDCTPLLTRKTVSSTTGEMSVDLTFIGHSYDCNCDKRTWECKDERLPKGDLSAMSAVARVTLTPETGKNRLNLSHFKESEIQY